MRRVGQEMRQAASLLQVFGQQISSLSTTNERNFVRHHARCHEGCDHHIILWSGFLELRLLQILREGVLSTAHCIPKLLFGLYINHRFVKH